jgi:hypothetical protein
MTLNEIIISLVKEHYSFTFVYENDVYSEETRQIVFTNGKFKSTPIHMKKLNDSHIAVVKDEFVKFMQ